MIHASVCSIWVASLFIPLSYSIVSNPDNPIRPQVDIKQTDDPILITEITTTRNEDTSMSDSPNFSDLAMESSTSTEMSVDITDDEDPKCHPSDGLEVYRNHENCEEYFVACVRPLPSTESESSQLISGTPVLKEQYSIHKRSCTTGYLFDGIEKVCMVAENAKCNETYETVCYNETIIFHSDPVQPSIFIECLNGTAKRQNCQPKGTIFSEKTQTCIKPPNEPATKPKDKKIKIDEDAAKSEPVSLSLLRSLVWVISSTNDKLSPWMETVKLHPTNSTKLSLSENFSLANEDDDYGVLSNDSEDVKQNTKLIKWRTNISEMDLEEDDEILVFTKDTGYLFLYYGVMVGAAVIVILTWSAIAFACSKICGCCDNDIHDDDDDDDDEFYKYNPNDKYVMTRL